MGVSAAIEKSVGAEMAAILPRDGAPWYKSAHLLRLNFCIFSLILFSSANGYDGSMMNGLQALPQWQTFMNHPKGAWLGFVNAAQALGSVFLFPVVAWSSNRFGRKNTIGVAYIGLALGVGLQTGSTNSTMFVLGRLIIGCASSFFAGSAPVLIAEIAFPTQRGTATSLYNCGWYVGSLIAAWATFGTRNYANSWAWRIPSLLQITIPAAAFTGWFMAPESPRWLAAQGRNDEAKAFLVRYHAGGDETSPLVDFELQEIITTLALEKQNKNATSWADLVRTKGNRHRTFIAVTLGIFAQWNGVGVCSYYLAPILQSVGVTSVTNQTMISGFISLWNLIMAVGAAFSVDRIGRRKLFLASTIIMLVSYILITALSASYAHTLKSGIGAAVIPFLFTFYAGYDIAFTPLLIAYPTEIYAYTLRTKGLATTLISTSLAVFFNIFVNPIALENIQWKFFLVYVIILVGIFITIWFCYPETNGHSLEEIARIFDGDKAAVPEEGRIRESVEERRGSIARSIKHTDISEVEKL